MQALYRHHSYEIYFSSVCNSSYNFLCHLGKEELMFHAKKCFFELPHAKHFAVHGLTAFFVISYSRTTFLLLNKQTLAGGYWWTVPWNNCVLEWNDAIIQHVTNSSVMICY